MAWISQIKNFYAYGQPVMSQDGGEIWAYFAQSGELDSDTLFFRTTSRLLGVAPEGLEDSDIKVNRNTSVYFTNGVWMAGAQTVQKDFAESPLFVMAPMTGPESVQQALEVLLHDQHFRMFFKSGFLGGTSEGVLEKLSNYRNIVKKRRASSL